MLLTKLFKVVVFVIVRVGLCTLSASYAELSRVFSVLLAFSIACKGYWLVRLHCCHHTF